MFRRKANPTLGFVIHSHPILLGCYDREENGRTKADSGAVEYACAFDFERCLSIVITYLIKRSKYISLNLAATCNAFFACFHIITT